MFAKGSRYRHVTQSSPVNAQGDQLNGTDIRVIEPAPGQFQHTVRDRDRLDLLAYKYYTDATRWWQICDANPAFAFPNDLLDRQPLEDLTLVIVHPGAAVRYGTLLTALAALGTVTAPPIGLPGDFVSASVVVSYAAAATRAQIVGQIAANGFHLLHAFAWPDGANTSEQFSIEDPQVKSAWHDVTRVLECAPGVAGVRSDLAASTFELTINTTAIDRPGILQTIRQFGFDSPAAMAQVSERTGARIVIPPNGAA